MAKSRILTDLIYNNCSLEDTLLRLLVICSDLGDNEIVKWIDNEQAGYKDDTDVPNYRIVHPILVGSYYARGMHYTDKIIDTSKLDKEIIEVLSTIPVYDSINNIEVIGTETQSYAIHPAVLKELSYLNGWNLYKASNQVVANQYNKIIAEVKNRLVKILIKLESTLGSLDEFDISKTKPEEKVIIIHELKQIIFDKSIKIGDNTTIAKSKIINKE